MKKVILFALTFMILSIVPSVINAQSFKYDNLGRISEISYLKNTVKYSYDNNGNRITESIISAPLPVELLDFRAAKQDAQVLLVWVTSREINVQKYDVEFSIDGVTFNPFETVSAKGNSLTQTNYQTIHCCPITGINYYRLKMIDVDGKYKYSPIRAVKFESTMGMKLYPNPIVGTSTVTVIFDKPLSQASQLYVYDANGIKILTLLLNRGIRQYNLLLNQSLPTGSYYVIVNTGKDIYRSILVKQ